ncbi:MAG TPA: M43 family zinc metalloprotease, partial [Saprospiraceae bacterium]|nr:M43 family zinc metalloprotease [Saprospiraceae bacterium]
HYLGLRHIWGDGGLLGANDCNQSDGVDDTPFANAQSNFDCAKTKNTCPKTEAFYGKDMPDLVENYMDYSSETCMNMFTRGQAALMRSVLEGPRKGLVASSGTHSPAPLADLSLAPNPASDGVALRFQMPQPAEAALRIFNLHGQVVAEQVLGLLPSGPQHILISIQHLPDGLYTAELRTASARWAGRLCKS